jgi:hypothetical protein
MPKKYNIQPMKAKKITKEKESEDVKEETKDENIELTPQQKEKRMKIMQVKMFKTALITYPIAGVFFLFAALIMTQVIKIPETDNETLKTLIIIGKGLLPVGFFFFMIISVGNTLEARGGIMTWKEMFLVGLMAIFMVVIDGNVVLVTIIGIGLIITYFYFIQARAEKF